MNKQISLKQKYIDFANQVLEICNHISVRDDEGVPYVFALGLKETHTLQLREKGNKFVLELWYGENSDVERVVSEPEFDELTEAFNVARDWLSKDCD